MQNTVYRLSEDNIRSLSAVQFNKTDIQFLVGTVGVQRPNKLVLLTYDDDRESLEQTSMFDYEPEVWSLCTSETASSLAIATGSNTLDILSISEEALTPQGSFEFPSRVHSVSWANSKICAASSSKIAIFNEERLEESLTLQGLLTSKCLPDPHHTSLLVYATEDDHSIKVYDMRDTCNIYEIPKAHSDTVLDMDFNPNNPYHLLTSSKDGTIKLWDFRKNGVLKTVQQHFHWVWQVKFNNNHDQLVLSSSSDNTVCLFRLLSGSSAPVDESFFEKEQDALLMRIEDFDDSVYSIAWSAAEPWHFATASFDGKVTVHAVPPEEKYKILL